MNETNMMTRSLSSRLTPHALTCALGLAILLPFTAAADITKTLTLQVYQVCNDSGANCASLGPTGDAFYAAETNKIWAQAGISVGYNFLGKIDSTLFSNIDDTAGSGHTFSDLAAPYDYQSSTVVDMFLVHTVAGAYGEGWQGLGGLVMGMDDILGFNSGDPNYPIGRIDTMGHELGHNLGLDPTSDPEYAGSSDPGHSNNPNELMSSGLIRNVPGTLADINPDGMGYDQFSAFQIDVARRSSLLSDVAPVPEPGSVVLMVTVVLGFIGTLRRRKV
jgi:hypothetical protein